MFMKSPIEWMLVSGLLLINSQKSGANLIIQQNYTTSNDGSLVYKCQFNVEVAACFWKVNGTTQSPGASGFDYIDGKKGISTKNCSIKFKKGKSFKNNSLITCSGQLENTVKHVKMACTFSQRVNCYWKRNEVIINIVQRYVYANGDGRNTTDCSIIISNVSNIDTGIWKCGTQLNDDTDDAKHKISYIYSIRNGTVIDISNLTKDKETTEKIKPVTESKSTPNYNKKDTGSKSTANIHNRGILIALIVISCILPVLIGIIVFMSRKQIQMYFLEKCHRYAANSSSVNEEANDCKQTNEPMYANCSQIGEPKECSENQRMFVEADQELHMSKKEDESSVVYTQVVIARRKSIVPFASMPTPESTEYATIVHKAFDKKITQLTNSTNQNLNY